MKLHELADNPGAAKKQKRVARGPGSGKGKMAGRGVKGQKALRAMGTHFWHATPHAWGHDEAIGQVNRNREALLLRILAPIRLGRHIGDAQAS